MIKWIKSLFGAEKPRRGASKYSSGNLLELYSHLIIRVDKYPETIPGLIIQDDMIYLWETENDGDKFPLGFLRHNGFSEYNATGHSLDHVVEKLLTLRDHFGLPNEIKSK